MDQARLADEARTRMATLAAADVEDQATSTARRGAAAGHYPKASGNLICPEVQPSTPGSAVVSDVESR